MRQLADGSLVLSIGYSPCPNDTFIFDALVNGRIDTGNLRFEPILSDVEALNLKSIGHELDITKISFGAYAKVMGDYQLLNAGSALGFGVGPLLVKRPGVGDIRTVAVPGVNTTANFLFSTFFPEITDRKVLVFSGIEDAVLAGDADAGVIIHENRFTYAQRGLEKVADLGEMWEQRTGRPIPLGGIAVLRSIRQEIRLQVDRLVKASLEYAWKHPEASAQYVAEHAQSMDPDVRKQHIRLYVNEYSLDLGEKGRSAIRHFLSSSASLLGTDTGSADPLFVGDGA